MGSEVEDHVTKKYDIKKRLGKGVRKSFFYNMLYQSCVNVILCRNGTVGLKTGTEKLQTAYINYHSLDVERHLSR